MFERALFLHILVGHLFRVYYRNGDLRCLTTTSIFSQLSPDQIFTDPFLFDFPKIFFTEDVGCNRMAVVKTGEMLRE